MQSNSNKSPTGICADHFWEDSLQGRQSTSPLSKCKPKKGKGDSRGFLRFLIFSQFCSTLRCAVSLPDLISHQNERNGYINPCHARPFHEFNAEYGKATEIIPTTPLRCQLMPLRPPKYLRIFESCSRS